MSSFLDLKLDLRAPPSDAAIRVAVVVLAAGASRRMGGAMKLLLDVGGAPMIRRTVENVLAFRPTETVVVTGHRGEEVEAALAGLPVRLVRNDRHAEGQPTSVAAGVRALTAPCDAVMVVLGDQPAISPADLRALVGAYEAEPAMPILVPHHKGRRGNPVVFAARYIPEVLRGGINVGCRHLIEEHGAEVARPEFDSDVYVLDCDTPDDYRVLLARLEGEP